MTDTTTLAPCPFCGGNQTAAPHDTHRPGCYFLVPPAPASGEPAAYRLKDAEATKHYGKDVYVYYTPNEFKTPAAFKYLEPLYTAPPAQEVRVPLSDAEALAIVRSVPALVTAEEEWLWAIREVEKYHGITAAQKEPK